jgi:hypothetical protein
MVAELFDRIFGPSKRTTAAGFLTFIAMVCLAFKGDLDNDPQTISDWYTVALWVGAGLSQLVGLRWARDNNVTSEKAGAK